MLIPRIIEGHCLQRLVVDQPFKAYPHPHRTGPQHFKEVLKQRMQALGPCEVALSFTQTVSKVGRPLEEG